MPIYEYLCLSCKEPFEIWSDQKLKCPVCGSETLQKLMSACNHTSSSTADKCYANQPKPGDLVITGAKLTLTQKDTGKKTTLPGMVVCSVQGKDPGKDETLH